jgi:transaldolase
VGSATQTINASTTLPLADSPLGRTISTTATDIWNDSCSVSELEYAISYGAVGATANPTIVHDVWKAEPGYWRDRVKALANERADATEIDLAWAIVEEMSLRAAPLLLPAFEATGGRQGRLSMQTDPTLFRSFDRMLAQGEHFAGLAPNIIVKFPTTAVGVRVMEEATVPRRQRQRHGVVLGPASRRGR